MKHIHKRNERAVHVALGALAVSALSAGATAVAQQPNPYRMADNSWITIKGTVTAVDRDSFSLDYGDGFVTVEMDDGDRDADAYKLLVGDEVSVSGRIDDDFYELTTIEASSVYVENIGTTFFASAIDEESSEGWTAAVTAPLESSETIVYGTVTDVDGHEFSIGYGDLALRVDVSDMPYDPLDDEGYQQIRVGDRVKVMGSIDVGLFEGRVLEADVIVELGRA